MKKFISMLLILMMTISLIGCGEEKDTISDVDPDNDSNQVTENDKEPETEKKPVHIKLFTGKVETVDLLNEIIKEFNESHPDIVVEQEFQKDASNVIKVKFASGDVPDITTVVTQEYIDQQKYLDFSNEDWWDRIQPAIKDMCTDVKSGKQYRVASNMTMAGLFYNKAIFEELELSEPKTWEEFEENLTKIKESKPDVAPFFMGGKDSWMLGHLIEFMAHGVVKQKYGVTDSKKALLANDDEKLQFGAEGGPMDSFGACILSLKEKELFNKDFITATYDNQIEAFANGEAAVISQGMWALGGILEKSPDMADNIGFMPYPSIVEGTNPVILSAEDSAYAITSESKYPEEAKMFLDYLFKAENLKRYSEFVKSPCAFTDVDADWGPIKDEVNKALGNGVNIGFTNESPSGFSGDDAGRMVQELYAGQYKTSIDFAKAYKEVWDKAWNASN
ncbi:MAG: extracellular solute-binding protein [Vallitalea sp.]|jgi:raffinose/stachyose/melibiose transport system substrate-binding protein|nr:extracellular solute-binding protein [Vallitalea sp.]